MTDSQAAEEAFALHRVDCSVCRAGDSTWADCPVGCKLMRAEMGRLAHEYKARTGPLRNWWNYAGDKFVDWFLEPRPVALVDSRVFGLVSPLYKTSRWEWLKEITRAAFPVVFVFALSAFLAVGLPRILRALYVAFRVFLRVLFRP